MVWERAPIPLFSSIFLKILDRSRGITYNKDKRGKCSRFAVAGYVRIKFRVTASLIFLSFFVFAIFIKTLDRSRGITYNKDKRGKRESVVPDHFGHGVG